MSDFTILRFQDCNRSVLEGWKTQKKWIFLWACAILLFFWNLGTGAVQTVQEGNLFYRVMCILKYDTPLTTPPYLPVFFSCPLGIANELSVRFASAVAGLIALGAVISIARRLFGTGTALASGWILLTTYGVIHYARLAGPDMLQAAFAAASVACYLRTRENNSFRNWCGVWILAALGVIEGTATVLLFPVLAMLLDSRSYRTWRTWKWLAGLLPGVLLLAWPVLHTGEWLFYFKFRSMPVDLLGLFPLLLPWTPLTVLAVLHGIFSRKTLSDPEKWLYRMLLGGAFISLLLFHSAVTLIPYCVILCGAFLAGEARSMMKVLTRLLLMLTDVLIPVAAVVCFAAPFLFRWLAPERHYPNSFVGLFYFGLPVLALCLIVWLFVMRYRKRRGKPGFGIFVEPVADRWIVPLYAMMLLLYAMVFPLMQTSPLFRGEKTFCQQLRALALEQFHFQSEAIIVEEGPMRDTYCFLLDLPSEPGTEVKPCGLLLLDRKSGTKAPGEGWIKFETPEHLGGDIRYDAYIYPSFKQVEESVKGDVE